MLFRSNFKASFNTTGLTKDKFTAYREIINEKLVEWREDFPLEKEPVTGDEEEKGVAKKPAGNNKRNRSRKKTERDPVEVIS